MGYNKGCGGILGMGNDWVWIIVALIILSCICGEGGLFGRSSFNSDCC